MSQNWENLKFVMRATIWKTDIKDGLVSRELADLFLDGKVRLIQEAKNFLIVEFDDEKIYERIYPPYNETPLKSVRDLYYYEKSIDTKEEFQAIIVLPFPENKVNITALRKFLPHRWFKFLKENMSFRDWLETKKEYKDEWNDEKSRYFIETTSATFNEYYKDDVEETHLIFEFHDITLGLEDYMPTTPVYIYCKHHRFNKEIKNKGRKSYYC